MFLSLKIQLLLIIICLQSIIVESFDNNRKNEIITSLVNKQCEKAENLILEKPNYTDSIPDLVRQVYNSSEDNTLVILSCVDVMNSIDMIFEILKSLRNEMTSHEGHLNPINNIIFVKILEIKFPKNMKEVQTLIKEIVRDIGRKSLETLKTAMLANNFQNNEEVRNLTAAIFHFRENFSDEIMIRLVNQTLGEMPATDIADNIFYGSEKIPQIIMGLLALFEKLWKANDTNNEAVLRIAKYISAVKAMDNYYRTSRKKKIAVNFLIESLPVCARSLYFVRDICITNRAWVEKLYASDAQFYFTRRSVFTCQMDKMGEYGIWRAEESGDKFYFRSLDHNKEYLYASTSDKHVITGHRYVQTWMDDGFLGDTSAWNIELFGDFCYIRNENFNEYMFVTDKMHGDSGGDRLQRSVFTSKERGSSAVDRRRFQWYIANCG